MPISVSDRGSNKPELIEHAAEVLGRSTQRVAIFRAIYTGKSAIKSVVELMDRTGYPRIRVLDAGKKLADQDLVEQVKIDGLTAYKKIPFFQTHRDGILRLAGNPAARKRLVTKRRPAGSVARKEQVVLTVRVPKNQVRAVPLTVDEMDSFKAVRRISGPAAYIRMPETQFKNGVARILGERGNFKDWGGESRDLFSTRLRIKGRRRIAAFAFKGPGKTGRLTPAKMGKNGDQIQRLLRCPAEVFIVQYWGEVDDSVHEQLQKFAELRSYHEKKEIMYGVIDGSDSARVITAYATEFSKTNRK